MSQLDKILEYNKAFVENREYEHYQTDKYPDRNVMIVTCMDTRLIDLLPRAIGVKNGDVQMVKTAGAVISDPYGTEIRSILVGVYDMGVKEVIVIGHDDCGMQGLKPEKLIDEMIERGIDEKCCCEDGIHNWLTGFDDICEAVNGTVNLIKNNKLMPKDVSVNGLVINPKTGELRKV